MKKLIIVAHPTYEKHSKVTKAIIENIKKNAQNTDIHFIDENGNFDVKSEQNLLLNYDIITFAFPLWWYSYPWTLKKWFDEVIAAGFGFSFKGILNDFKLKNKKFSYIVSVGNTENTYQENAQNKHTIENYFMSLDGLTHLLSSAWTASGQSLSKDQYFIKPIISYGGAVNKATPEIVAKEYIDRIDSL